MNSYIQGVDHSIDVRISDGISESGPRKEPCLYVLSGCPGHTSTTTTITLTKNSAAELREMADKAEKDWAEWEAYQQEMHDLGYDLVSRLHPVMEISA